MLTCITLNKRISIRNILDLNIYETMGRATGSSYKGQNIKTQQIKLKRSRKGKILSNTIDNTTVPTTINSVNFIQILSHLLKKETVTKNLPIIEYKQQ